MQVNPWIIAGSLLGALAAAGCYDDSSYQELLEHASGATDTDADADAEPGAPSGGETQGTTITTGGTTITTGAGSDGDDTDTDPPSPAGPDGEVDEDTPPAIHGLTIDAKAVNKVAVITAVHTAKIEVLASDDRALASVTIMIDDEPVAVLAEPPFAYAWTIDDLTAAQSHSLRAVARDDHGQEAEAAINVAFDLPKGGAELWLDPGPKHYSGTVEDLRIAPNGDVIAAGTRSTSDDGIFGQAAIRVLAPLSGDVALKVAYPPVDALDGFYRARAVAVGDEGTLAMVGSMIPADDPSRTPRPWLGLFAKTGKVLATRTFAERRGELYDLELIDGDLLVAGDFIDAGARTAWIARVEADTSLSWEHTLDRRGEEA